MVAPVRIGNVELTLVHKYAIVGVVTLVLVVYTSGLTIFWVLGVCCSSRCYFFLMLTAILRAIEVVLLHSGLRERSLKSKVDNMIENFRGENELLVPLKFISESVDVRFLPSNVLIQLDANPQQTKAINEEQDDLRNAEFQQKREAYHQLANNMRVSISFLPFSSLVFEGI